MTRDAERDDVRTRLADKYTWLSPRVTGTLPSPRAYHTSTAAGTKMLVFGGWFMDFCNDLMVLDTAALEWSVQVIFILFFPISPAAHCEHAARSNNPHSVKPAPPTHVSTRPAS